MGGVMKHLNHLYDNRDLTFAKLKQILSDASRGRLQAVEKVDGAAIALSYRDGKATYARNKTDLLELGRDLNDLLQRDFKGGDSVKKAYVDAFNSYRKALSKVDEETLEKLFSGGTIFYAAEIVGPAFTNVINYDKNTILIHDAGHKKVNRQEQTIEDFNNPKYAKLLDKIVDKQEAKDASFNLQKTAVMKLRALSNDRDLEIAKARIDKAMGDAGIGDNNTIGDYIKAKLMLRVQEALPEVSSEIQELVALNLMGEAKLTGEGGLPPGTPKELKQRITQLKKQSKQLLSSIIWPIEEAIHDFSVEMLKGLESAYVLDNKKELKRLRVELAQAIKAIQSSGNEDAIRVLQKQLSKVKKADNINTTVEGFVFNYDGMLYKFTGNYAPVNQILGMFKFGRGKKIPPMKKKLQEIAEKTNKTVAILPGSFKPPHDGHYQNAKYFAEMPNVDVVFVLISPKNRDFVTNEMSKKIWDIYTKDDPKIEVRQSNQNSPVKEVYDFMETLNPGDTLVLGMGEKEVAVGDTRFDRAQQWSDKNNLGVKVEVVATPMFAGGVSGTLMRKMISDGLKKRFFSYLPKHLGVEEKQQVWSIVSPNSEPIKEGKTPMIKREDIIEERMLREHIRKIIKSVKNEEAVKEQSLRKYIQKIIKEETSVDDKTPHQSTGINVLENLLKKIIPTLEEDYKSLTTDPKQRKSFRAHILNAIENSIAPQRSLQDAGDDVEKLITVEEQETEEDLKVSVKKGNDKFIDIENKPKMDAKEIEAQEIVDNFSVPGEDSTGRNVALNCFNRIEQSILDSYNLLENEDDVKTFYDYLITNLKLYFDKFEDELQLTLSEPTTEEYEEEKQEQEEMEDEGEEAALGGLEEPEEEV
jgi:hypothetical protein